jgi:hypothetical protein
VPVACHLEQGACPTEKPEADIPALPAHVPDMADIPDRCAQCAVRDSLLCSTLDDDEVGKLNEIAQRRIVAKRQVLLWSGDLSTVCANIVSIRP